MAIQIPIITEFQDQGLKNAKGAFANFKSQVGAAEGAMGKFKAGSVAALDIVKANAGTFALGAGAALGAFAAKAVTAFQDLALKAGEFSAKTGLVVDDASRWIEVAGDIGVNIDAVEGAIGRMNRTIASDPNLVRKLGDDIAYTNEGGINVNETFLNVIQRLKDIKDPTERAKEGAKLFGKGWQEVALLIEMGSDDIKRRLGEVADTKVINKDELRRARDFRDALDDLKDKGEELALSLGESLLPILIDVATAATDFIEFWKSGWGGINSGIESTGETIKDVAVELGLADTDFSDLLRKMKEGPIAVRDSFHTNVIAPIDEATLALEGLQLQWDELSGDITSDMALRDLELQLGNVKEAAAQAFGGTQEDMLNYQNEVDRARLKLIELGQELDLQDQRTLKLYVDKSDIEGAVGYLKALGLLGTGFGGEKINQFGRLVAGARANGGPVTGGRPYIVGENGPELFVPGMSGGIIPNSGVTGGASTINITVMSADPNEVVRALQSYNRNVGKLPVQVQ